MVTSSAGPVGLTPLERFSEPFPPHGALAAEGAANLLGRPRLDPLVVLVREAVQNSWDARLPGREHIDFALRGVHLSAEQRRLVRSHLFASTPRAATRLRQVTAGDDLLLLALTDRGTTGLGGPLRADRPPPRGTPSDFVDLLFNIGQPSERAFGGGTYGFGKTISYVVSQAQAIVVHTRTTHQGRAESRLIAAAFTDHYSAGRQRYTGRHWWGRAAEGSIEPLVGDDADALADAIGLPPFTDDETGTTIAVIAPDLGGRTVDQAFRYLSGALTWNFWPKMLAPPGGRSAIDFAVTLDGEPVAVAHPRDVPPLHAYATALEAVRRAEEHGSVAAGLDGGGDDLVVTEVVLPRNRGRLGWLALTRVPVLPRPVIDEGVDDEAERGPSAAIDGVSHHTALLRHPELVVEYWPGVEPTTFATEWAGVFKPTPELDATFAKAEPPTHDAWQANLVADPLERRAVNTALRVVRDTAIEFVDAGSASAPPSAVVVADALWALVGEVEVEGVDDEQAALEPPYAWPLGGEPGAGDGVRSVRFTVVHADGRPTAIEADARAATGDGSTSEREGDEAAELDVIGFVATDGRRVPGTTLVVDPDDTGPWQVDVRAPAEVSAAVTLTARTLDGEEVS